MSTFVRGYWYTHYVFRPGAGSVPYQNIYNTWADLYAAVQAQKPDRTVITFDGGANGGVCTVPAGTYAFAGQVCFEGALLDTMQLSGGLPTLTEIDFAQGVTLSGVQLFRTGYFRSLDAANPCCTINGNRILYFDQAKIENTAGSFFFRVGNGFAIRAFCYNASQLFTRAFDFVAGSTGHITVEGEQSVITTNALAIAVGATVFVFPDAMGEISEPFTLAPGGYNKGLYISAGYHFRANGALSLFALTTPFDGQPCVNRNGILERAVLMQRVDSTGAGAGGNTSVTVYRRSNAGTRVAIATGSIAAGSGNNARINMTFAGTSADRTFVIDDQLECEFTAVQTPGATTAPADVTVSIWTQP